jgi:hypothetical protein
MNWWPWKSSSVANPTRVAPPTPPAPLYNYDDGSGGDRDDRDEEPFHLCWSCQRELKDAEGVSIDESTFWLSSTCSFRKVLAGGTTERLEKSKALALDDKNSYSINGSGRLAFAESESQLPENTARLRRIFAFKSPHNALYTPSIWKVFVRESNRRD